MTEDQKPWLEKLKEFTHKNNYKIQMLAYNNNPQYKSSDPAPVLRIETKISIDQIAIVGQKIMTKIFGQQ